MGNLQWAGEQGLLVIRYDDLKRKWYAYMPVETQAFNQPIGQNRAYVDLGVRYLITAGIEKQLKPIAYNGTPLLTDWWYWNKRITEHQRELKLCNGKHSSTRLRKLYRTRQLRFRHAINTCVKHFVERCHNASVKEIAAGDLTGIRENSSKGAKQHYAQQFLVS
jgi:putative transposase